MDHHSYLKTNVDTLHKQWVDNLRDIRGVTDPASRSIYTDDLKELYERAILLDQHQELHPQSKGALRHILDRPLEQHLALLKNTRNILRI